MFRVVKGPRMGRQEGRKHREHGGHTQEMEMGARGRPCTQGRTARQQHLLEPNSPSCLHGPASRRCSTDAPCKWHTLPPTDRAFMHCARDQEWSDRCRHSTLKAQNPKEKLKTKKKNKKTRIKIGTSLAVITWNPHRVPHNSRWIRECSEPKPIFVGSCYS